MPGAISRSAHHQPLHQHGGRFQAQPPPGCVPSKARKTHVLNGSRAPSAGAGSNGRAPSPRCSRAGCLGVGRRGVPHPEHRPGLPLPLPAWSVGRAGAPALAPAADVLPVPGVLWGLLGACKHRAILHL